MKNTLVILAVAVAAAVILGAYTGLTATGQLTTVTLVALPDAVLTMEITERVVPLAAGRYVITRPDFFDQQVASGLLDSTGSAQVTLKAGILYKVSVHRKDNSLCKQFNVELLEGASVSLSCAG